MYSVEAHPPYAPIYVSRGIEGLGYTREEWLQDPERWVRSIHPDDRERVLQESQRAFAARSTFESEYRLLGRDGSVHWIHDRGSFVVEDGKAVEWRGIMVDVTARKDAELALVESEERYRKVVETTPDVILIHAQGRILFANPSAATLLGAGSPEGLLGKPLLDFVHPDWHDRVRERIRGVTATGVVPPPLEFEALTLDGRIIPLEATGSRVTYRGETAIQVTARDISARRQADEAMRIADEQVRAAQRMEVVGQLAGGVAHDFNNLLTVITCHADFLADEVRDRKLAEEVEAIQAAVKRAAELTRQLLAFGRRQVLQPRTIDANAIVQDAAVLMRRLVPEHITIEVRTHHAPLPVHADRGQVEQVITNLILNSRDAMPEGGELQLRTSSVETEPVFDVVGERATAGAYARITVADTGMGMDTITAARAFEPFFTTKPFGRGSGLGLSSVHGIVKQSGGFVTLDSTAGEGTSIHVHLPLARSS